MEAASRGVRVHTPLFTLLHYKNDSPPHFGLTVTKKMGNAVVRNRIKRRLRGALDALADTTTPFQGHYVIIAKPTLITEPFPAITETILYSLKKAETRNQNAQKKE